MSIPTQQTKNFVNPAFASIFDGITRSMPGITFYGIIATYLVTASVNVWSIPLPIYISVPAALAIQFGRFAVVFLDFLNPTGRRSTLPGVIATGATAVALIELAFSLQNLKMEGAEFWSLFLFGGMVIAFGYLLEVNFIKKGAEAFGLVKGEQTAGAASMLNQVQPATPTPLPTPTAPQIDVQAYQDEIQFLRDQVAVMQLGNGKPGRPKKIAPELLNGNSSNGNGNGKH
jgi:hypothetical protein